RRPRALRAGPVRRLPRHARCRPRLHDRDLRRAAPGRRELAVVGGPVLHPHRQAPADHPDRGAAGVPAPAAPAVRADRRARPRARPARRPARPVDRGPARPRRPSGPHPRARGDHPRHDLRRGGRRGTHPLRGAAGSRPGGPDRPLHRPGRRRGELADRPAPARLPAPRPPLRPGVVGTAGGRRAAGRARPVARALEHAVTAPRSTSVPSPSPPIEDYAFLSDCHAGALVAPDGAVGWLCVPRFDSPSVFGSLLDRQAGDFRFGPFGVNTPTARAYEPGTNILTTTWNTSTGWLVVRDALTMGPRPGDDPVTPHTRPPTDDDADHVLVRV